MREVKVRLNEGLWREAKRAGPNVQTTGFGHESIAKDQAIMTELEHREDIQDLGAELERVEQAFRVACQNIVVLNEQREAFKGALSTAMIVIDQLLTDLRLANGVPSKELIHAKLNLDVAMQKLFKETD